MIGQWGRRLPALLTGMLLLVQAASAVAQAGVARPTLPPLSILAGSPFALTLLAPTGEARRLPLPSGVAGLAQGAHGVVLLLPPSKEPPLADLGLVALQLVPDTGALQLLSLDFTTPHEGSLFTGDGFTELEGVIGTFPGTPFALDAFHGGGVGAVFAIGEAGLLPDPAYRLPPTGDLTLEGSRPEPGSPTCVPPPSSPRGSSLRAGRNRPGRASPAATSSSHPADG